MQIETWLIVVNCEKSEINLDLKKKKKILFQPLLIVTGIVFESFYECVIALSHAAACASSTGTAWDPRKKERLSTRWCTALAISKPGPLQVGKHPVDTLVSITAEPKLLLPHGRTPHPTCSMCVLAQSKAAVDSTRLWFRHRRNSRSASVHQGVLAEQRALYLFIYHSNPLCQCMRLSDWLCLGRIVSPNDVCFRWT